MRSPAVRRALPEVAESSAVPRRRRGALRCAGGHVTLSVSTLRDYAIMARFYALRLDWLPLTRAALFAAVIRFDTESRAACAAGCVS